MVLTGRGGFGNYKASPKISAKATPDSPELSALKSVQVSSPSPIQHYTSPHQTFRSGRGGYGNRHAISDLHVVTPSEYLKELHDAVANEPVRYTVGRGGRGNFVDSKHPNKAQEASSHHHHHAMSLSAVFSNPLQARRTHDVTTSGAAEGQADDGLWHKLRSTLSH